MCMSHEVVISSTVTKFDLGFYIKSHGKEKDGKKKLPSSVQSVVSNNDLLIEILVRLPFLSLILFKSVSKRWLSLIRDAINVTFRRNPDQPSGLFLEYVSSESDDEDSVPTYSYNFLSLDNHITSLGTNFTFGLEVDGDFEILDSCNGLLLCRRTHSENLFDYIHTYDEKLYVYNPSITNMFKVLPEPSIVTYYTKYVSAGGFKMAFDPSKSPHYKVIYAQKVKRDMGDMDYTDEMDDTEEMDDTDEMQDDTDDDVYYRKVQLYTFSSETGNWSLCGHQFAKHSFQYFEDGVYWNDAIYWPIRKVGKVKFVKLEIENEHPVLTAVQTPSTSDLKKHYVCEMFESRGCLLLLVHNWEDSCSQHYFTIYEKRSEYSEWSVKYIVNLDDIIKPFPNDSLIKRPYVFCIVLGEREEDSFMMIKLDEMMIKLDEKVVQYKIVSKAPSTISDLEDRLITSFQFIPSFTNV